MRKKELLRRNISLFDQLEESKLRIKDLATELKTAKKEIADLKQKISSFERKKCHLEITVNNRNNKETASEQGHSKDDATDTVMEARQVFENSDDVIRCEDYSVKRGCEPCEKAADMEFDMDSIKIPYIDYASSIIGKIVIAAAEKCNELTKHGSDSDIKMMVNLILGRTEVAKAEILKIILSEEDDESKKSKIDASYSGAVEYFDSIMAQRP